MGLENLVCFSPVSLVIKVTSYDYARLSVSVGVFYIFTLDVQMCVVLFSLERGEEGIFCVFLMLEHAMFDIMFKSKFYGFGFCLCVCEFPRLVALYYKI